MEESLQNSAELILADDEMFFSLLKSQFPTIQEHSGYAPSTISFVIFFATGYSLYTAAILMKASAINMMEIRQEKHSSLYRVI